MEASKESPVCDNQNDEVPPEVKKCRSALSSVENSPLMDRESLLRYSASSRDEFWDALSSNYDYLMDDGLINTCREASSDLSVDDDSEISESTCWSFKQFIDQFKCLHDILHNLQVTKEESSRKSDGEMLEEQQNVAYLCKLFNEQAQKLSKRYPEMKDEVHKRLNLLNNKWKAVEQSINPMIVKSPSKDKILDEISHHMSSLRRWLRELESRVCPVNAAFNWTVEEIDKKHKEQTALQKEIEGKEKHVSGLLKLCEHLKGNVRFGQNPLMTWDAERVRKVAKNLQHKWHLIWIKSLESLYTLEKLLENSNEGSEKFEKSFSEEPLKKYPRLSDNYEKIALIENELKIKMNARNDCVFDKAEQEDSTLLVCEVTLKNDKAVMVGDTVIAELKAECGGGKFEIVQDIGYSSETSAHLSMDEKSEMSPPTNGGMFIEKARSKPELCYQPPVNDNLSKIYLAPDKYPSVSLKALNILSEDRSSYKSKLTEPKCVPDKFYQVTCVDEEDLEDLLKSRSISNPTHITKTVTNGISERNTTDTLRKALNYEALSPPVSKQHRNSSKAHNFSGEDNLENGISASLMIKKLKRGSRSAKPLQSGDLYKKSERVSEWLNSCQSADDGTSDDNVDTCDKPSKGIWSSKVANSSCDASGECTTNESDSEKSATSDVNNSITMSQSFTGSIETVIPAVPEDNGVVQKSTVGIDPSPSVKMRKKRRARDRPWSVIETNQVIFSHNSVPHSTSEGALDLLYLSQDSGKMNLKKSRRLSRHKRFSLTDVSMLCSPSNRHHQNSSIEQNHMSSSSVVESRKKSSLSDPNSDFCEKASSVNDVTLVSSEKDSIEEETLRSGDKLDQVGLTAILPEISLSLETDTTPSVVNTEDQASISDQAWDEYQDPPYLSEPYSEQTADEDEVRKLINFGDDYRTVLGSYSDISSVNLRVPPPKYHRNRTRSLQKSSGGESCKTFSSDSDSEDFYNILKTSNHTLQVVNNRIKEFSAELNPLSSEIIELTATCQTNLCHLNVLNNELSTGSLEMESVSKDDIAKLQALIKAWEDMQAKVSAFSRGEQKVSNADLETATLNVHNSLSELKSQLCDLSEHAGNVLDNTISLKQVVSDIQALQNGLSNLQELKDTVLAVNARVLRLIAEGGGSALAPLKDKAKKLYQQWEDVYELHCTQLTKLQTLQSQWCESEEKKVQENLETTVQWQPVQVGSNLPNAELKCEDLYEKTAAEVQIADQLDVVFEIENKPTKLIQHCLLVEGEEKPIYHETLKQTKMSAAADNKRRTKGSIKTESTCNLKKNRSCFWRTLIASVPIQIVLVLLYCISVFYDPQCCENMNSYDFTLLPRLRYFKGPPPA